MTFQKSIEQLSLKSRTAVPAPKLEIRDISVVAYQFPFVMDWTCCHCEDGEHPKNAVGGIVGRNGVANTRIMFTFSTEKARPQ